MIDHSNGSILVAIFIRAIIQPAVRLDFQWETQVPAPWNMSFQATSARFSLSYEETSSYESLTELLVLLTMMIVVMLMKINFWCLIK